MHRGKNEVILIEQWITSQVPCCARRIQCQLGQEPLSRRIATRNLLELLKVRLARVDAVVNPFEMRLVPTPYL